MAPSQLCPAQKAFFAVVPAQVFSGSNAPCWAMFLDISGAAPRNKPGESRCCRRHSGRWHHHHRRGLGIGSPAHPTTAWRDRPSVVALEGASSHMCMARGRAMATGANIGGSGEECLASIREAHLSTIPIHARARDCTQKVASRAGSCATAQPGDQTTPAFVGARRALYLGAGLCQPTLHRRRAGEQFVVPR
jgi:hypothetical protein